MVVDYALWQSRQQGYQCCCMCSRMYANYLHHHQKDDWLAKNITFQVLMRIVEMKVRAPMKSEGRK